MTLLMKRTAALLLLLLFLATPLCPQNQQTSLLLEEAFEELADEETERNWENELEELAQRLQEPIDLNQAGRKELELFPFLTDRQIENLLAYVYIHGEMQTLYELQLVEDMDRRTIELLSPFVCAKPKKGSRQGFPTLKKILKYGKHEAVTRLDIPFYTRKGYRTAYLGPSPYHSLRYRFHYGDYLQIGITGEKDAGEPLFALHNAQGYDHYSYYLQLQHIGRLENLLLGHYRLSFGQGLVLGSSFQLGKTFSLATADHCATGIRKHGSTDEYNYFRGIAATIRLPGSLELSSFYSHRTLDGIEKEGILTSIQKTGLHRTQREAERRGIATLQLAGGHLNYHHRHFDLGATGIYYFFNRPYEPSLPKYARYNLHGQYFHNLGLDYRLRLGRLSWAGEAATGKQGYAFINRLSYTFAPEYRLMLIHRFYAHDYWAFFAHSFSEGSTPQNENGWYVATEVAPLARWRFFASADFFSFPWWKYRISRASQGIEGRFQASYAPRRELSMLLNYRYRRRERDVTGSGGEVILPTHHHRLRYRLTCTPAAWTLRTTLDYNLFRQQANSHGYQCTQSCSYSFTGCPLTITLQGSYFHTDDYDSRIYLSEKGLLYTFYAPAFSGRGFRYTAHVRYEPDDWLLLLLKFGHTIYQDRESIGSGNDLISGNRKADLQMQMRIRF